MYAYDPISSLLGWSLIIGITWGLWKYLVKYVLFRARYCELYKLHKLEEELKKRKLSFKHLDVLADALGEPKQTLKDIDEAFEADAKLSAK